MSDAERKAEILRFLISEARQGSRFREDLNTRLPRRSTVDFDAATRRPLGPMDGATDAED